MNVEKSFDKIQHPLMIKTLNKMGVGETYLNMIMTVDDKPTVNIILKGGNFILNILRLGTR